MHPGAVGAALVVAVWFVIVMAISFSLTAETAYLAGEVGIHTGEVSGREALVQLLTLPITLALGAMAIGMIFDMGL